ncbi:S49 family peptidase [Chloroflexota bacterium]
MTVKFAKRWLNSIYFFILLGLILGGLTSVIVVPKPIISEITVSGAILERAYVDSIIDELQSAKEDRNVKAVVLKIDSPGGAVSAIEPIYFEILELKRSKPVVASVGTIAASGGYYIAVATNFIYAQPNATVGSVGVIGTLPGTEKLDENVITTGPFKRSGQSRRRAISRIETIRQQFVEAVTIQRGERLQIPEDELSQASVYSGTEGLRYGLIDDIGMSAQAMQKAAELAHIRSYSVTECLIQSTEVVDIEALKSRTNNIPLYYYLYFELE